MLTMNAPTITLAAPVIGNLLELDALVENIVELQRSRSELLDAQDAALDAVRQKYRAPLAEVERYLAMEMGWAETWARQNPVRLKSERKLDCTHATIGFRQPEPRVERASRKWTWTAAAQRLAEVAWGGYYLRTPAVEVNKEALVADRAKFTPEQLREVGLKMVEQERFHVAAHGADVAEEPTDWQEAA